MMTACSLSAVRRLVVRTAATTHRQPLVAAALPRPAARGGLSAFRGLSTVVPVSATSRSTSTSTSATTTRSDTPPRPPPEEAKKKDEEHENDDDDPAVYDHHLQFTVSPPEQLTVEMARGIADATQFFLLHGLPHRRLQQLAQDTNMPVVTKWQKMLETYLSTQIHVLAGMGYGASEQGLSQYAQDLSKCLSNVDNDDIHGSLRDVRRDTWRSLVATSFNLHPNDIPTLSIVDARNLMHKVSSKMMEPNILHEIETRTQKACDPNPEVESAQKHDILQQIIVDHVYLGGTPSITEQAGFGIGPQAYAKMQCAMSDHEGDPLIAQYATAAMLRIWQAAGLDVSSLQQQAGGP